MLSTKNKIKYTQNLGPFSWTLIQVPDLPAHLGRLLLLHVVDGGEGGLAGGVQGQVASNLPDLLLLLDACTGPVFQSTHKVKCCFWMSAHCTGLLKCTYPALSDLQIV